jgi:hypothetical protein
MPLVENGAAGNGGSIPSGAGSPLGSVVPAGIGELYIDATNGALWVAVGATNADWVCIGGSAAHTAVGVYNTTGTGEPGTTTVACSPQGDTILQDSAASQGSGNGVYWRAQGLGDGNQELDIFTGTNGAFTVSVLASGVLDTSGASGVAFPSADPHVAGAWWDNGVTLMRSAG